MSINKKKNRFWDAKWITSPRAKHFTHGVYFFRKNFLIKIKPSCFHIYISAHEHYDLFVNNIKISQGPAHSDLLNWNVDSIELSSYIIPGNNIIAIQVYNMGANSSGAQLSNRLALFVQGHTVNEYFVNTDQTWKVKHSIGHMPCSTDNSQRLKVYMVTAPGDEVRGGDYPWGWQNKEFSDSKWSYAAIVDQSHSSQIVNPHHWVLKPRTIPIFNEELLRLASVRRTDGLVNDISNDFLTGLSPQIIPPQKMVSILVDQSYHIVAYPELIVSAGKGANIVLTYAESLFNKKDHKGNRNDIDGKHIKGNYDKFTTDGGKKRKFRPLTFRTYRYIQIDIWTKHEALIINDFYGMRTGYPIKLNAEFDASDKSLKEIWNAGWLTLQNCTGDCFYDTPYYEQLQYTADSRIQALIMLYTSGDDRLMRKCLSDFYNSRTAEGLTQSRYPSRKIQVIPAFSLFWISMIHDYWMHRKDDKFVEQFFPTIITILTWFEKRIDQHKKMLGPLTWWNFVDWDNFNSWGTAPGAEDGNSAIITLQLVYTLRQAAELFNAFERPDQVLSYIQLAEEIGKSTYSHCFDLKKGLIADTPEKVSFSQHVNIWAILSETVKRRAAGQIMHNLLYDNSIAQVTYFYRFYLNQALKKAGMAHLYYNLLKPWRDMIELGLTTFAEKPEPTRSDCHGWSASPSYDFLATILGITPGSPGFATVLIQPALGELTEANGRIPHPQGFISVSFKRKNKNGIYANISLPENLTGTFKWKDKNIPLHPGTQYHEV